MSLAVMVDSDQEIVHQLIIDQQIAAFFLRKCHVIDSTTIWIHVGFVAFVNWRTSDIQYFHVYVLIISQFSKFLVWFGAEYSDVTSFLLHFSLVFVATLCVVKRDGQHITGLRKFDIQNRSFLVFFFVCHNNIELWQVIPLGNVSMKTFLDFWVENLHLSRGKAYD